MLEFSFVRVGILSDGFSNQQQVVWETSSLDKIVFAGGNQQQIYILKINGWEASSLENIIFAGGNQQQSILNLYPITQYKVLSKTSGWEASSLDKIVYAGGNQQQIYVTVKTAKHAMHSNISVEGFFRIYH